MCVLQCLYVCIYSSTFLSICLSIYSSICLSSAQLNVYLSIDLCMCTYIRIYALSHLFMYMCVHVYMHMYMHIGTQMGRPGRKSVHSRDLSADAMLWQATATAHLPESRMKAGCAVPASALLLTNLTEITILGTCSKKCGFGIMVTYIKFLNSSPDHPGGSQFSSNSGALPGLKGC